MKHILIAKDVAYAAKTGSGTIASIDEVNLLAEGAIAFFNKNGSLIPVDSNSPVAADITSESFIIACGVGGKARLSPMIDRRYFKYVKGVFTQERAQIKFLGSHNAATLTGSGSLVVGAKYKCTTAGTDTGQDFTNCLINLDGSPFVGDATTGAPVANKTYIAIGTTPTGWGSTGTDTVLTPVTTASAISTPTISTDGEYTFELIIDDLEKDINDKTRRIRYEYVAKTGDTAAIILTALVNRINNNANSIVTAAIVNTDDGIKFTHNKNGKSFDVTPAQALEGKLIIDESYGFKGNGNSSQIGLLEEDYLASEGYTQRIKYTNDFWQAGFKTVSGEKYHTYVMTWQNERVDNTMNFNPSMQELVLCVPTSNSNSLVTRLDDTTYSPLLVLKNTAV